MAKTRMPLTQTTSVPFYFFQAPDTFFEMAAVCYSNVIMLGDLWLPIRHICDGQPKHLHISIQFTKTAF